MKKLRIILLNIIVMFSGTAFSQEFAPIGAKWYYDHFYGGQAYLTVIEAVKDTLVDDKECAKLSTNSVWAFMKPDGTYYWDTLFFGNDFVYYSNDTVFHYLNGSFYPLYLFNVNPGDTILVKESAGCDEPTYYCSRFEYIVDTISNTNISGHNLKLIYNSPAPETGWVFVTPDLNEPIIELIGSTRYFWGAYIYDWLEGSVKSLRCYDGGSLFYKGAYWELDCDYLMPLPDPSSITSPDKRAIKAYPNPFNEHIFIETGNGFTSPVDVILYTSCGKEVISERVVPAGKLQLHKGSLQPGVYILEIKQGANPVMRKKLVIY
jgi:hypothetical protein